MWAEWFDDLFITPEEKVPWMISISYGDLEKNIPLEYPKTVCEMFDQLGALGASVLCSSGDDGVGKRGRDSSASVQFVPSGLHLVW